MSSLSTKRKAPDDDSESPDSSAKKLPIEKTDSEEEFVVLPYDVLRIIFNELMAKDLNNAAQVCKLWEEVAKKELKRRKIIAKLMDYNEVFEGCYKDSHFHHLLTIRPMLGIFFNSLDCPPPACLTQHLPDSCLSIGILNRGIIMNSEIEHSQGEVAFTLLPDCPGVNIEFIVTTNSEKLHYYKKGKKFKTQSYNINSIDPIINDSLKRLKEIKCMILFASEKFSHVRKLCKSKAFRDNVKSAWGGVAKEIFLRRANDSKIKNIQWLAVLISGRSVQSWSTVVNENDKEENVKEKLLKLKNTIKLKRHTIGFMFSCVARGSEWYDERENVESTIFKSIFPQIPLIGSFGNGEFAINTEDPDPINAGLFHQYSTGFMILTYG